MERYLVAELFSSINGEGLRSGQLAVFVRFAGCNLCCSYCDTMWANEPDVPVRPMDKTEIYESIRETGIENVTLTGGEPLLQEHIEELISFLLKQGLHVEIETNGSVDLSPYAAYKNEERLSFTMDYKLAGSGMEEKMRTTNFSLLRGFDTVKFVVSNRSDLERAGELILEYHLTEVCHVYLSPVFGRIEPQDIVEYMKACKMNRVTLQIQMHKIIWDPNERGV